MRSLRRALFFYAIIRIFVIMKTKSNSLHHAMLERRDPSQVEGLSRFFKTGPGQYGEGDVFLGIKVPVTRAVVKDLWKDLAMEEVGQCLQCEYHEIRLAALLALVQKYKHAKKDEALKRQCVDFYLSNTEFINNWDLVDLSCYEILGDWVLTHDRQILYDLAATGKTIWEQRIGIVSTMQLLRHGELDDTYSIADIFLQKPAPLHDLLQKAVGWLLREAGKRDQARLMEWLEPRCSTMPRTALRYAIERFSPDVRDHYLGRK